MKSWSEIFEDTSLVEIRHKMVLVGELLQAWRNKEMGLVVPSTFDEVMEKASIRLGFPASHERVWEEAQKMLSAIKL